MLQFGVLCVQRVCLGRELLSLCLSRDECWLWRARVSSSPAPSALLRPLRRWSFSSSDPRRRSSWCCGGRCSALSAATAFIPTSKSERRSRGTSAPATAPSASAASGATTRTHTSCRWGSGVKGHGLRAARSTSAWLVY